ncbi:MAG: hypothetical protein AMK73_09275, partial [Planctomycetes bacterium SM23_32]
MMRALAAMMTLCLVLATGAAAQVEWVREPEQQVPQYGQFELAVRAAELAGGAWVTEPARLGATFVSPSGRTVTLPAFRTQDYGFGTEEPRQQRASVGGLKIYVSESDWALGQELTFFLDDVRLQSRQTGESRMLGDFEADAGGWGPQAGTTAVTDETAASGRRSLRVDVTLAEGSRWPGAFLALDGADWRGYDRLAFAVRLEADAARGHIRAEYGTTDGRIIRAGGALDGEVPAREWTELTWDFDRSDAEAANRPVAAGEPYYAIRFMPTEPGRHTYTIRGGGSALAEGGFECLPSELKAPARVSRRDPFHLERTDGTPWLPVGLNMCWYGRGRTADYEEWLPALAAAGGDVVRLWMCPWCFGVEWGGPPGDYRMDHAYELDHVLRRARELGIGVMLCLDYHGAFQGRGAWRSNPYNAANGGPCEQPEDFFTSEEAARLYRERLSYLVARYASYSNLAFWEFFNEVNLVEDFDGAAVAAWHARMARYLRDADPYDHIITTSCGNPAGDPHLWTLPEIELAQSHDYAATDWAANVAHWTEEHRERYGKAAMFGEFGLNAAAADSAERDPDGIYLHNGLWGSAMSGSAGAAMIWFWDNYVHERDLYHHFTSLKRFAEGVDWTQGLLPLTEWRWERGDAADEPA